MPTEAPESNELRPLLTAEEVGKIVRRSALTVKRWARERKIPFVPVGNEHLFDATEIQRWLDDKRVPEDAA